MGFVRCDQTPAWAQLKDHHASEDWDIRAAFARDPQRAERFSQSAAGVGVDFSKMPIHTDTEKLLHTLAHQCGVAEWRDAMFAGEAINTTEQRQVMHWMLRQPAGSLGGSLAQPLAQVHETLDAQASAQMDMPWPTLNEAGFRLALNQDAMATEKLAEGIRAFCADAVELETLMRA